MNDVDGCTRYCLSESRTFRSARVAVAGQAGHNTSCEKKLKKFKKKLKTVIFNIIILINRAIIILFAIFKGDTLILYPSLRWKILSFNEWMTNLTLYIIDMYADQSLSWSATSPSTVSRSLSTASTQPSSSHSSMNLFYEFPLKLNTFLANSDV